MMAQEMWRQDRSHGHMDHTPTAKQQVDSLLHALPHQKKHAFQRIVNWLFSDGHGRAYEAYKYLFLSENCLETEN